ncbi:MAG TPA: hypothetical protein VGN00_05345 [Puia sp.]
MKYFYAEKYRFAFAAGATTIEHIYQWTAFAGCGIPILLMMHFRGKQRDPEAGTPALNILGIASLLLAVIFGVMLSAESSSSIYWARSNYNKTRELAQMCESRTFVNSKGERLRYSLLKPLNYDPGKKYPIVVSLSYGGQPQIHWSLMR